MELKRIAKDHRARLLFLLLLLTAVGVFFYQQSEAAEKVKEEAQMWEEIYGEAIEDSSYEELQADYADNYEDWITSILEQGSMLSGISIFQNTDSYSYRNLSRTQQDYANLSDITLGYGNYEALEKVLTFSFSDYLIFLWGFFLVWMFFEDEKKGLKQVFYATPGGRKNLARSRIGVLAAGNSLFVIPCELCLLASGILFYGGIGNLFCSAQSIMLLENFVFRMNILEFLIVYVLIRCLLAFSVSLITWMILSLFRSRIPGVCLLVVLMGAEGIACNTISELSPLVILKYANLFRLIQPGDVLYTYRNYNFNEYPFNGFETLFFVMMVAGAAGAAVSARIMIKRRPLYTPGRAETALMRVADRIRTRYHRILSGIPVFQTECYKVLIVHKGIWFVGIWLYLLMSQMDLTSVSYMGTSAVLKEAYDECTGSDMEELRNYIEDLEEQIAQMPEPTVYRNAADTLTARLEYMERMNGEEIEVWFLNEKPYKILWTGNGLYTGQGYGDHQKRALYDVILLVFLISSVFSYDQSCGMEGTLRCTRNGRNRLFSCKIMFIFLMSVMIGGISYGLELYETNQIYSLTALTAPIQSLTFMEDFPLRISIGVFLALLLLIRLLMLFSVGLVSAFVSSWVCGVKGLACALIVTSAMEVLHMLGFSWCGYLSLVSPIIFIEALEEHGTGYAFGIVAITALIGVFCYRRLKIYWCGRKYHAA